MDLSAVAARLPAALRVHLRNQVPRALEGVGKRSRFRAAPPERRLQVNTDE